MDAFYRAGHVNSDQAISPTQSNNDQMDGDVRGVLVAGIEDTEEALKANGINKPTEPTEKEVEEHERTHLPYRDWCKHCVMGRGRSEPHRTTDKSDRGIPKIS